MGRVTYGVGRIGRVLGTVSSPLPHPRALDESSLDVELTEDLFIFGDMEFAD